MYYGPTSPNVADEVKARLAAAHARDLALLAARQEALNRVSSTTAVVAVLALAWLKFGASQPLTSGPLIFFGALALASFVIRLAAPLPFHLRAAAFLIVQYGAAVAAMAALGLGSAGWVFFISFATLAAMFYGTRGGVAAGLLALLTWAGFARLYTTLGFQPLAPLNSGAPLDWLLTGTSLAVVMVALIWPQRQFFEMKAAFTAAEQDEPKPAPQPAARPVEQRMPEPERSIPVAQAPIPVPLPTPAPAPAPAAVAAEATVQPIPRSSAIPAWLQDGWGTVGLAMGGYLLLFAAWTIFHWGGPANITFIADAAVLPLSLFAAVCAWRVAGNASFDFQLRAAWLILGFTAISQFVADLIWFLLDVVLKVSPFPSVADIFYLSFYPLVLAGLLNMPRTQLNARERIRFWVVLGGVMLVATLALWRFIIAPAAAGAAGNVLTQIITAAYPIGDLVLLAGALAIIGRQPEARARSPLFLYLAGLIVFFAGDLLYAATTVNATYTSGGWLDVTWPTTYLLFGFAALQQFYLARQALSPAKAAPAVERRRTIEEPAPAVAWPRPVAEAQAPAPKPAVAATPTVSGPLGIPPWLLDRWGWAGLAVAGYLLLFAAWTVFHWGGEENLAFISDLAVLPLSLFAAVCAWRLSSEQQIDAQLRSAWLILGFTAISQFAADLIWFLLEIVLRVSPYPSVADVFYLSFYPLVLAGLLSLPGTRLGSRERTRFWVILGGVMVVASLAVWRLIILPMAASAEGDLLTQIISGAYPIGDLVLLAGGVSILGRQLEPRTRAPLYTYLAGLGVFFAGDLLYAITTLNGTYASGSPLDVTWAAAYLLFGFAALQQFYLARQSITPAEAALASTRRDVNPLALRYAAYGAFFGLGFPVVATLLDIAARQMPFTLASAGAVQATSVLHWIIDTAPIVLGVAFGLLGFRQDQVQHINRELAQEIVGHQTSINQLQHLQANLEQEISRRTADLEKTTSQATRRADQLAVSAEVARVAAALQDLPALLSSTVQLISSRFGYYHAGIFLVDDSGEYAVLQAANSPGGQRMLARNHRLRVGAEGIVGFVTRTGQPRIAFNVGEDAVHFRNPDLPETHSEAAVPLRVHGRIIGALDVQSVEVNAFSDDDVQTLQAMANLLAVAIDNARLFEATRRALQETREIQLAARRAVRGGEAMAYRYDGVQVQSMGSGPLGEAKADPRMLQIPIRLGDEALGVLELKREEAGWSPDDVELTEAIAGHMALALENARLFETTRVSLAESEQLLKREQAVIEIGARLQQASSVKNVLQITAQELRRITGSVRATVRLSRDKDGS